MANNSNKMIIKVHVEYRSYLTKILLLLAIVAVNFVTNSALAQQTTLEQANLLYNQANYEKAASLYQQVLNQGYNNGHLYYNLANTYYRLNKKGLAIVNYRKALHDLPRDPDIKANLELTRKTLPDKLTQTNSNLFFFKNYLNQYELTLLFSFSYIFFWLITLIRSLTKNSFWTLPLISSLAVCIYLGAMIFIPTPRSAVIIVEEANLFSGNSETFQVISVLHDGAEAKVQEIRDHWIELVLNNGRHGWTKKENVEVI